MQRLEVTGAVRPINGSLGVKRLLSICLRIIVRLSAWAVDRSCELQHENHLKLLRMAVNLTAL